MIIKYYNVSIILKNILNIKLIVILLDLCLLLILKNLQIILNYL